MPLNLNTHVTQRFEPNPLFQKMLLGPSNDKARKLKKILTFNQIKTFNEQTIQSKSIFQVQNVINTDADESLIRLTVHSARYMPAYKMKQLMELFHQPNNGFLFIQPQFIGHGKDSVKNPGDAIFSQKALQTLFSDQALIHELVNAPLIQPFNTIDLTQTPLLTRTIDLIPRHYVNGHLVKIITQASISELENWLDFFRLLIINQSDISAIN